MTITAVKRPRGRPRVDTAAVNVRMPAHMIDALDAFIRANIAAEPLATRPDAVRYALQDWLLGHGYLRHDDGPRGGDA